MFWLDPDRSDPDPSFTFVADLALSLAFVLDPLKMMLIPPDPNPQY